MYRIIEQLRRARLFADRNHMGNEEATLARAIRDLSSLSIDMDMVNRMVLGAPVEPGETFDPTRPSAAFQPKPKAGPLMGPRLPGEPADLLLNPTASKVSSHAPAFSPDVHGQARADRSRELNRMHPDETVRAQQEAEDRARELAEVDRQVAQRERERAEGLAQENAKRDEWLRERANHARETAEKAQQEYENRLKQRQQEQEQARQEHQAHPDDWRGKVTTREHLKKPQAEW